MLILVTSVRPHVRLWPASVALLRAASYVTRLDPGRRRKQTRRSTARTQLRVAMRDSITMLCYDLKLRIEDMNMGKDRKSGREFL